MDQRPFDDRDAPSSRQAPRPRRLLVVVNPGARSGDDPIDAALDVFRDARLDVVRERCVPGCTVSDAIRAHDPDGFGGVVVGGGDGTMNAALPALLATGLPLGILPLGTGNDLARTLAIPADPSAAAQVVVDGRLRTIDVGDVNGHPFLNVASVGFSVALAAALRADLKRRWGRLGYLLAAIRIAGRIRPFRVEIAHDGGAVTIKAIQVSVGNGRHYGGGLTVHRDAEPDDGILDLHAIELKRWWRLLAILPALRTGSFDVWPDVHVLHAEAVRLATRRQQPVNADGEIVTTTPAEFRVMRAALRVFAPPPPARPKPPAAIGDHR